MPSKLAPSFGRLPTHLDLPSTDGKPVENTFQIWQTMLLMDSIIPHLNRLHPDGRYMLAGDTGIYYQITDPPLRGCKAPDWYYVPGVSPVPNEGGFRRSYVMWQEMVRPMIVMEYVSDDRGEEYDRTPETGKFWAYETAIAVPYYVIYEPFGAKLEVLRLNGARYEPLQPDSRGLFYIEPLQLNLGLHYDTVGGYTVNWMRWFDRNGELVETNEEQLAEEKVRTSEERARAEQEKQHAEREKQRAEQEKRRADALTAKLRELGVDPESV